MGKALSIIIPVFKESIDSLHSLLAWIGSQQNENNCWILSISNDQESIANFKEALSTSDVAQTEFWQQDMPEKFSIDKEANIFCTVSKTGRSKQMNQGARLSSADILLFLHADTILEDGWIEEIQDLAKGNLTWGSFRPSIKDSNFLYRMAETWGYLRSKYLAYPYGDQCIFVKGDLFQRVGQFDEEVQFMEDLELSKKLKMNFGKPAIMRAKAITSSRRWKASGKRKMHLELIQSIKNVIAFLMFISGVPRERIHSWYQM